MNRLWGREIDRVKSKIGEPSTNLTAALVPTIARGKWLVEGIVL
jgi:hypothetical protein